MINVLIAGAQKAGTTSIHKALGDHPDVQTHEQMEMTFFYQDDEYEKGETYLQKQYGVNAETERCYVAKNAMLSRSEQALSRLAQHNPECKIIFCARDPVERAFSSYLMEKRNGNINHSFDEVMEIAFLEREKHWYYNVFVELGCYDKHLDRIGKFFPEHQIKVVELNKLKMDASILNELIAWIGLDPYQAQMKVENSRNEPSIMPVARRLNQIPFLKLLTLHVFGRKLSLKVAKKVSGLMGNHSKHEQLDDYSEWKDKLREFYASS